MYSQTHAIDFRAGRELRKKMEQYGLTDEDLQELESLIMQRPEAGPMMKGTGGLRKIRFAPPSWRIGKSGATRVCYVVFTRASVCYLIHLFAKNEQPNLAPSERAEAKRLIEELERRTKR